MTDIIERLWTQHKAGLTALEDIRDYVSYGAAAEEIERLREALRLADAALRGSNMDMKAVEKKVRAALRKEK